MILEANYLQPQLEERAKGSTGYAAVRPEYLLSADIPLPPLEKQRRIAALADYFGRKIEEITKLIAQDKKESEVLLGRISSRIYDNLAKKYGTQELVEISQQITDGTHQTPIYVEKGVPFISVKDITTGKISFSDAKYVTEATHKKLVKRAKPEKGDILLTKVGTTGYAKMIDVNLEFSIFVSLCLIKLQKEIVLPKYVEYILNSDPIRKLSGKFTRGVGNKNLVLKFIEKFPIPVPPLNTQATIAIHLNSIQEAIERLKMLQIQRENEIKRLLPNILDRAFKGDLLTT